MRRLLASVACASMLAGSAAGKRLPVGVTNLGFTKTSVTTGEPRPLDTVVWYPAARRSGTQEPFGLRDAKPRRGRFPLVVFSHGTCGLPTEASYLTMALAAEGFVVAAPPHPGNTANESPQCLSAAVFADSGVNRQPDVSFVIDSMIAEAGRAGSPFARRIDTGTIGVSGLSFGGFTALLTAVLDPRIDATLALVPGGTAVLGSAEIGVPTMVIGSERDTVVTFAESERAYAKLTGPRFLIELLGGGHLSVVDTCDGPLRDAGLCGDLSQDDAHALVLRYALPFARRYLGGKRRAARSLTRQVDGVVLTSEPTRRAASGPSGY